MQPQTKKEMFLTELLESWCTLLKLVRNLKHR